MFSGYGLMVYLEEDSRKRCEGTDEAGDLDVTRRVTVLGPGITTKNKTVVLDSMYILY
jgi:hypothetical protein